jgi:DNA-binding transcriptional LysR family regulator
MHDLDDLRCFLAAAERLNFRAASKVVGRSPAAFSDRIKRLEEALGASLFDRTSRQVSLTAAGHRLLPHARRTLDEAAACRHAVLAGGDAPAVITLGTRFELGLSWLLPAVRDLEAAHPSWTVHLLFGDTPALLDALRAGDADAIIGSMRLVDPGLATRPLHEESYTFVGAPDLLARQPLDSVADAPRHTLLDVSGDLPLFRYWRDRVPPEQAWSFGAVRHLGTISALRAWAREGRGVAVLPTYFVQPDLDAGTLTEVLPDVQAGSDWFRLVWRAGHPDKDVMVEVARVLKARPLA